MFFHFDSLFELYEESSEPEAASLESLLRKDWGLFEGLDRVKAEALLAHVFDNLDIFRCKFVPSPDSETTAILQWEAFREELKHQRRFFPTNNSEIMNLETSFVALESRMALTVYRARACEHGTPFMIDEMGKPPEKLVGNGRANPVGIPCLYVASDADTAVAEIRPHKGEVVCVAEFKVETELSFVDLRNPRSKISPFSLDEENLRMVHRNMSYLCRLGDELTMPILPRTAHLDYLPSQYLCEFIKSRGYDGVVYKSAMGSGINYAIFNDSKVSGINICVYQVDQVYVESSLLESN
ncbi:MAG: RES family NAD+ phosphorylase [Thermodesulfobacteriota bacterium]|nr:RES family NAD+ phosphorylase [Thermodesulfobacteriota bacterium]